jgi:hypothetical protein
MRNLKNLVQELEGLLHKTHGQLDTDVFDGMQFKVDQLKQEIDKAESSSKRQQLALEALRLLGILLSLVTNVTTLLK